MNIAVNTRLLLKGRLEGIGRFGHEILSRLTTMMPEHQFHFLFDRAFDDEFIYNQNVTGHSIFPQARHPILYNIWFHRSLPKALRRIDADILFSIEGYLPLKADIPLINVIHDINFEHEDGLVTPVHQKHFRKYFPKYARTASEIITVSEFSKEDIVRTYKLSPDKLRVVHNGVSDEFAPLSNEQQAEVRTQWTDGKPYFIFIGAIHPRKNIVRLLQAFDRFKRDGHEHKLVLVGNNAFMNEDVEQTCRSLLSKDDVVFTGRLSQADMIALLASATALTYVPTFEGFGIPVIEAFKCNTPVISSNVTSIPEVAGDSALLVDPLNSAEIFQAMNKLITEPQLAEQLKQRGQERAGLFSWDRSAEQVKSILEKHLGQA